MSFKFMSPRLHHKHFGPNDLCPRIGVLIKILFLYILNNKNALVQVIDVLNRPQNFTWINTGPVYRYTYAPL